MNKQPLFSRSWIRSLILIAVVGCVCFLAGALTYRHRVIEALTAFRPDTTGVVVRSDKISSYSATIFPARFVNMGPIPDGIIFVGTCSSTPPIKHCFVYSSTDGFTWRLARDFSDGNHSEVPLVYRCSRGTYATLHPEPIELWRSSDDGESWSLVFSHPTELTIYCMAETPEYLLFGTWPEGFIYRSGDGVTDWTRVHDGADGGFFSLLTLASGEPESRYTLYAGSHDILRSRDGGATWHEVASGDIGPIRALLADERGAIFAGGDAGFMTSRDGGDTWRTERYDLARDHLCHYSVQHRGYLYVGGEQSEVYRSKDGGESWEMFFAIPQTKDYKWPTYVRGITAHGDYLYVGTSNYRFKGEPIAYLYRIPLEIER